MGISMELSRRLKAVTELVTRGNIAADVGCDHGYVAMELVCLKICPYVIAMDVNQGPLEKAREHVAAYGLSDYIDTRLSDGVSELKQQEADTLILAGMGGRLMQRIIQSSAEKTFSMKEWVLQPQSEIAMVRRFIREQGWQITKEDMVREDGKFYPMFRAEPAADAKESLPEQQNPLMQQAYDKYGKLLLLQKNQTLYEYLLWEQTLYENILQELVTTNAAQHAKGQKRIQEIAKEKELLSYALSCYTG